MNEGQRLARVLQVSDQAWSALGSSYSDIRRLAETGLPTNQHDVDVIRMALHVVCGDLCRRSYERDKEGGDS